MSDVCCVRLGKTNAAAAIIGSFCTRQVAVHIILLQFVAIERGDRF